TNTTSNSPEATPRNRLQEFWRTSLFLDLPREAKPCSEQARVRETTSMSPAPWEARLQCWSSYAVGSGKRSTFFPSPELRSASGSVNEPSLPHASTLATVSRRICFTYARRVELAR